MAKKQAEKISKPGLVGNTNAAVENPRNVVMTVRVTQAELDAAKSNAASYGMGLAQFVRYAIKATRASR